MPITYINARENNLVYVNLEKETPEEKKQVLDSLASVSQDPIQHLRFGDCGADTEDEVYKIARYIHVVVLRHLKTLKTLEFGSCFYCRGNYLPLEAADDVMSSILKTISSGEWTPLQTLGIELNKSLIGPKTLRSICDILASDNCRLEVLDLTQSVHFTVGTLDGWKNFFVALEKNKTLRELYLGVPFFDLRLSDEDYSKLITAIQRAIERNTGLEKLDMNSAYFDARGQNQELSSRPSMLVQQVVQALQTNRALRECLLGVLEPCHALLNEPTLRALASMLLANTTLHSIGLRDYTIGDKGAIMIAEELKKGEPFSEERSYPTVNLHSGPTMTGDRLDGSGISPSVAVKQLGLFPSFQSYVNTVKNEQVEQARRSAWLTQREKFFNMGGKLPSAAVEDSTGDRDSHDEQSSARPTL